VLCRGVVSPAKLPDLSGVRYAIDADDKICFVDEAWGRFAQANDGSELAQPAIIGQALWNHISDETTRKLYQQIVARVRKGQVARFRLRCDGPKFRRLLEMTIRPALNGSVEFETGIVQIDDRAPLALLSRDTPRSSDLLRVCAWCTRVDVSAGANDWVEVEEAADRLRLFELEKAPQLTHGICEVCLESMTKTIENMKT